MESSYRKSARDTVIIGVATLVEFLIGFIQVPLLTKFLGAQEYGIWSQVYATAGLIAPFVNLGLGGAMVRFLAAEKNKEEIQEGFYSVILMSFAINLVTALVVIVFANPIATNFFGGAVPIVRLTGILILLAPLSVTYLLLIRTFQHIKTYSSFLIAENCLRFGLIAYLVLTGYGIFTVVLAALAVKVLIFVALFFLVKSQIGIKWPRFSRIREFLSFGLPLTPAGIAFWLVNLSDRYVVGYFLGVTSVGVYSAGCGLGSLHYSIMTALTFVLMATLPKLYDEGRMDEVKTHLRYTLKYFLAIAIPFVFGAGFLGKPVLRLFTTPQIAEEGYQVVPVIALAVSFLCIYNIILNILLLVKKPKKLVPVWIIAAVLNIGLNIVVVPRIGVIGAALTTLLAYSLALGVVSYYSFKEFTFPIDWPFIVKSLIASVIMSTAVWMMHPQSYLTTIITVIVGVIIYSIVLLLLRGFSKEEFKFFRTIISKSR